MQYNQLFIEVDGTYYEADLGDFEVAVNIQSFNALDVENRFIDYSQAIEIPSTQANNKIFKHANDFTTYSDIQDMQLPCLFLVGGINVFGLGSFLNVKAITDIYYECQIVGGSSEFFNSIKGKNTTDNKVKTINDLQFEETITRSYDSWVNYTTAKTQTLFFAAASFDRLDDGIDSLKLSTTEKYVVADYQKPFIWFRSILDKILEENGGYTLETNIDDDDLSNMAVALADISAPIDIAPIGDEADGAPNVSLLNTENTGVSTLDIVLNAPTTTSNQISVTTGGVFTDSALGLTYTATINGTFVFDIDIYMSSDINFTYSLPYTINHKEVNGVNIYKNDVLLEDGSFKRTRITDSNVIKNNNNLHVDRQMSFNLNTGDVLVFSVFNELTSENTKVGARMNTTIKKYFIELINVVPKVGIVAMNQEISPINNLPDITQFDFFMAFLQMFCGIVYIDNYKKTIRVDNFDKILENKSLNIDWSDKIKKATGTIDNSNPYAQKNIIKYKDTKRSLDTAGRVTIEEDVAEDLFNKDVIIYWYALISTSTPEYGSITTDTTFPSGQYKYQTLGEAIEKDDLTVTDEAYLYIENDKLPEEETIITLPFEAVEIYKGVDRSAPDLDFQYAKFRDCEEEVLYSYKTPRLVTINGDVKLDIRSSEGATKSSQSMPYASSINDDRSVQAILLVSKYYSGFLDNILSDFRMITGLEVDLNEVDIEKFTPYKPVYIEKYGSYFHVNKINNYTKDKLTEIDLIKI